MISNFVETSNINGFAKNNNKSMDSINTFLITWFSLFGYIYIRFSVWGYSTVSIKLIVQPHNSKPSFLDKFYYTKKLKRTLYFYNIRERHAFTIYCSHISHIIIKHFSKNYKKYVHKCRKNPKFIQWELNELYTIITY